MTHGHHTYTKAYDMAKAKMCTDPQSDHAHPHWKCVLRCCAKCPCIDLFDQEKKNNMNKQHTQLVFTFIT